MTGKLKESEITRRSVLRKTGGAAGVGLGVATAAGSVSAHKDDLDCPTCDEDKGGPTRYKIAHRPPGNPENCQDLCLPESAARAHLEEHEHDTCGPCRDGYDG